MSLTVRDARLHDLPEVSILLRESFAESLWPYMVYAQHGIGAYLAAALRHPQAVPRQHYLVAADTESPDGRILGFAEFRTPTKDVAFLSYICVSPGQRNRGIASQIFRYFFEHHSGITTLELDVFRENAAAVTLYRKLGLEQVASSKWLVLDAPAAMGSVEIPAVAVSAAAHQAYGFSELNVLHEGTVTKIGRIGARVLRCFNRVDFERTSLHAAVVGVFPSLTEILSILPADELNLLDVPYRVVLTSDRMKGSAGDLKVRL
jgi:ribosomal protein S18 acetylase RimI-like enzyme